MTNQIFVLRYEFDDRDSWEFSISEENGFFHTAEAAQKAADELNKFEGAYEAYVKSTTARNVSDKAKFDARMKEWKVLTDAGIKPSFPKPMDPPNWPVKDYEKWIKTEAKYQGIYTVESLEANPNA